MLGVFSGWRVLDIFMLQFNVLVEWLFPHKVNFLQLPCKTLHGNIIQSSKERKVTSCFSIRPSPSSQTSSGSGLKQPTTPPRPLTARTWASTTPTILSHAAFSKLCAPNPVSSTSRRGLPVMVSSLEKFLCCVYLKRHLMRVIQNEELVSTNKTFQMSGFWVLDLVKLIQMEWVVLFVRNSLMECCFQRVDQ